MNDNDVTNIEIELLIQALLTRYQYDFRQYSRASLRRRLEQAKIRFNCHSISEIQHRALHDQDFFPQLIAYLTVNTTEFFRDPSYFVKLRENVLPFLQTFPSLKIWIAGCSTGEEVISLSILFHEAGLKKFIIYATDINPMNLDTAKKAIYPAASLQKASRQYQEAGGKVSLSEYYTAAYDSVKFDPSLLSNVVFSDHSLSTDSVFSEMHFISCRNVLIYFDRPLQDRVLELFKDSLVRGGFLGLGNKESIQFSTVKTKFTEIDRENRLFQKVGT